MYNKHQLPYGLPFGTCLLCVHPWLMDTGTILISLSVGEKH